MLKNSVIIDILKDCNSFNLTQWNNTSSTSDIEFNVFFIYSNNPNKFEIVDYFNESKKSFNLISNQGFKEFKKYLSINAVHALFIYGNKQTKKILGSLIGFYEGKKNETFFTELFGYSFHIKDIFKNFNTKIIDLDLAKKLSSIKSIEDTFRTFQEIDQLIQIIYEDTSLVFTDDQLLSFFNYKEFNRYFCLNFDDKIRFKDLDELNKIIEKAIYDKLLDEKKKLDKVIFIDLEAIDYSSECTAIGLIKDDFKYKKIIKPLKNNKPTKFMVNLTGITREMLLQGTLFKDMLSEIAKEIPNFEEYSYLVFGVYDKFIWKSSFDKKMSKTAKNLYYTILKNFYDFSSLSNTCMVDYTVTNNNLSLVNSLKFIGINPIQGIHDPIIDAANLKLLYENFFKEENISKYIKNNISFYMKKSISSSNFKTLMFCLYSGKKDKTIFEYYLRHKIKENIKNLQNRC